MFCRSAKLSLCSLPATHKRKGGCPSARFRPYVTWCMSNNTHQERRVYRAATCLRKPDARAHLPPRDKGRTLSSAILESGVQRDQSATVVVRRACSHQLCPQCYLPHCQMLVRKRHSDNVSLFTRVSPRLSDIEHLSAGVYIYTRRKQGQYESVTSASAITQQFWGDLPSR